MEDPLDINISEELIEVNAQEEVTSFAFDFQSRYDNVAASGLQLASTGVLFFYLDGRVVDYLVFVESVERFLAFIEFENCNMTVSESLLEWVGEIVSIDRKSTTGLCH